MRALAFPSSKPWPAAFPLWHPTVSSIREVVLGAAVLLPPQCPEEFAAAILRVSTDAE
jgi:hypothetical protein